MKIQSITLSGYKRLLNNNMGYIKLDFDNEHQLILGTNGSGKSSVIAELSPLPAFGGDFVSGGFKSITIEHKNSIYTLISFFDTQAGTHLFYKDNIQLNTGRLSSIQKDLVKDHFNFDAALFDILTDQQVFHSMSPTARQEWFTKLSGSDLDYIFTIYNKVRDAQRTTDGALKHINERLTKETSQIKSDSDIENLEQVIAELNGNITIINRHLKSNVESPQVIETKLLNNKNAILELKDKAQLLSFSNSSNQIQDSQKLQAVINQTRGSMIILNDIKQKHIDDYMTLKQGLEQIEAVGSSDIETLEYKAKEIESNIETMLTMITTFDIKAMDGKALYYTSEPVVNDLLEAISELPNNNTNAINKQVIEQLNDNIHKTKTLISELNRQLNYATNRAEQYKKMESVSCPNCHHAFKPHASDCDVANAEAEITTLTERIKKGEAILQKYESEQLVINDYLDKYKRYRRAMVVSPLLEPLYTALNAVNLSSESPSALENIVIRFRHEVGVLMEVNRLTEEKIVLEASIARLKDMDLLSGQFTQERLTELNNKVVETDTQIHELECGLDSLLFYKEQTDSLLELYAKVQSHLDRIDELVILLTDSYVQQNLNQMYESLLLELSSVQSELTKAKSQKSVMDDLSRQKDILFAKNNNLKVLLKELSPKTGMIADQFINFLIGFIQIINNVISEVWSYDMELILQSDEDKTNLSFKFPIYFAGTDAWAPDPAKCSSAQKGIIDFAFKIAVIQTLGLNDYPLYLDELAPSLDEKHRINIMAFVKQFIEARGCSQMYMVSHYMDSHAIFTNAEVAVLDYTNLLNIPEVYNKHVVTHAEPQAFDTSLIDG